MKPTNKRPLIVLAICAVCTLAFLILWARGFVPLQEMEFFAQDWQTRLGRKTPVDDRLVLIGIDKPVYSSDFSDEEMQREPVLRDLQNNFPWSRAVWARLIEKLAGAGAKVILFDLVFASPGEGDDELHQALEKYKDRVVIGYNINVGNTERGDFKGLLLPNPSVLTSDATNSSVEDGRLGYVNLWPDFDDTLRRVNYRLTGAQVAITLLDQQPFCALASRATRAHPSQHKLTIQFFPIQPKLEIPLFHHLVGVGHRLPHAHIPHLHCADPCRSDDPAAIDVAPVRYGPEREESVVGAALGEPVARAPGGVIRSRRSDRRRCRARSAWPWRTAGWQGSASAWQGSAWQGSASAWPAGRVASVSW